MSAIDDTDGTKAALRAALIEAERAECVSAYRSPTTRLGAKTSARYATSYALMATLVARDFPERIRAFGAWDQHDVEWLCQQPCQC
jgi:hypothetical protein